MASKDCDHSQHVVLFRCRFMDSTVNTARQHHNWWLSLSSSERATKTQLPVVATMRAELLSGILPDKFTTLAMQKGSTTVLDLLFLTFQTFLPSEPSARVMDPVQ